MISLNLFIDSVSYGNPFDLSIIRGTWRSYRHVPVKGRVVLDIGAHIGSYSVMAALHGAARVVAVEPLPRNLAFLKQNAKKSAAGIIEVIPGAARYADIKGVTWLRSTASAGKNQNFGHNTVEESAPILKNEEFLRVVTVDYVKLLKDIKPYAIKMDCEGSEFNLLLAKLPKETKWVFGEIHFHRKEWRESWPEIKQKMADQGFAISRAKQSIIDGTTNLHGLLTWSR